MIKRKKRLRSSQLILYSPSQKCQSEADIQSSFFQWCSMQPDSRLKWIFAITNENQSLGRRIKNNKLGVKAGVADVFLPWPTRKYHGLWLEFKTKRGTQRPAQRDFGKDMNLTKYLYEIVRSVNEAIAIVDNYLNETN